jgi:hypothetical protein
VDYWRSHGWQTEIEYNDGAFPSHGRNRILEKFYNSTEEWLAMCDDDTTMYNHRCQTDYFVRNPEAVLSQVPTTVSLLFPMNNISLRVAATHSDPIYSTHWRLERDATGKIVFHRRTQHRFYQRTDLPAWEDFEWGIQQIQQGYYTVRLNNAVLREQGANHSSLFRDQKHRVEAYNTAKQQLCRIYPELYINPRGQFVRRDFTKKYSSQPRYIDCPYQHTPYETLPLSKKTATKQHKHFDSLFDTD